MHVKDLPVPVYMYVQGVIARPLDPLSTRLAPIGDSPVYTRTVVLIERVEEPQTWKPCELHF